MNLYTQDTPFISKIKYKKLLNETSSVQKTYFFTLDIKNSNIQYNPGDSVAILPENDPRIVDLTINYMKADPNEEILEPKTDQKIKLFDFLIKKANITKASPGLINLFTKKDMKEMHSFIMSHHIWDILKQFPKHKVSAQDICNNMLPLLPRLYSAASSLSVYPNEINLIIKHVSYELSGIKRNGVTTEFICHIAQVLKTPISIYIQPSHGFNLTKDLTKPIIMITAGCGVAPFKSFLEERYFTKATGNNWLFFGEKNSKCDFYFEDFYKDLIDKNFLRLTTTFSRDQKDKIYVQDKVLENASDIWQWIHTDAIIYICGDVKMARGVDEKLEQIFMQEGNLSKEQSRNFLRKLIRDKRYLKDVY